MVNKSVRFERLTNSSLRLCRRSLINTPYREIADITGVVLGTVGRGFNDLKNGGYILEYNNNRRLKNKKYLLDRWVDAYLEKLGSKLIFGIFTAENDQ